MVAEKTNSRLMERHFQTAISLFIAVFVGLLAYNFNEMRDEMKTTRMAMQSLTVTTARQEERISAMINTIKLLSQLSDDRYRSKDAEKDFSYRDVEMRSLTSRVVDLEKNQSDIVAVISKAHKLMVVPPQR